MINPNFIHIENIMTILKMHLLHKDSSIPKS